jgi:5,5'-dehydrodivanillate O-demethylase oxygenase subunit
MATSSAQNDRLPQIGPGTPMGNLLRHYWQVVGAVVELDADPVRRVRILGENLTLYRSEGGECGLIGDRCPHRCMDMRYGIPHADGIRCAYHGWLFNAAGTCLEMPFEDRMHPEARFREKVTIKAYPVQELGGLLFGYLGPLPAPPLPRWDLLAREDLDVVLDVHALPCNWLQCMDNAADPVHFEWLHANFGNYQLKKLGRPPAFNARPHVKIAFEPFKWGITKRRLLEGEAEDSHDWVTGHPLLFPNALAVMSATGEGATLQFRVPVDDTNTVQFAYRTVPVAPGAQRKGIAVRYANLFNADGSLADDGGVLAHNVPPQDMLAWVAQGSISERAQEHLGSSDRGVIMYHKMLVDQMERVERGERPTLGVVEDPRENEPYIELRRERVGLTAFELKYDNYFERIDELAQVRP